MRLKKTDIIKKLSEKLDLTDKTAKLVFQSLLEIFTEELIAGNEIPLTGLGIFKQNKIKEGIRRNPINGKTFVQPEKKVVRFSSSKSFKILMNS